MDKSDLFSRMNDLADQCQRKSILTHSHFLTPAEQHRIAISPLMNPADGSAVFQGGTAECERKVLFFLPYYMDVQDLDWAETISVLRCDCRFGNPGHRDYLGTLIGLGIRREFIGDIWILDHTAYLFCLNTVKGTILQELNHVGRDTVSVKDCSLPDLPVLHRKTRTEHFTVMSPRLDSVVSGLFRISRADAADHIRSGLVQHNYEECLKPDAPVRAGDTISLRGRGKGCISSFGGTTRRGRTVVEAILYI